MKTRLLNLPRSILINALFAELLQLRGLTYDYCIRQDDKIDKDFWKKELNSVWKLNNFLFFDYLNTYSNR